MKDPVKLAAIFSNSNDISVKSELIKNPYFDKTMVLEIAKSGFNSDDYSQRTLSNLAIRMIEDESVLKFIYNQIKREENFWDRMDTIKVITEQTNNISLLKEIEKNDNPDARKLAKIGINRLHPST